MVGILKQERLVFARENLTFTVQALATTRQIAILRESSKVRGRVDSRLLMLRTLEMGIVDPPGTNAETLITDYPEVALLLAVRIADLTTG